MRLRSLRSRLLLGSVLWTLGLLPIAHLIVIGVAYGVQGLQRSAFGHTWLIVGAALAIMALGLHQFRRSLSSFDELRARLAAVREGRERRIEGVHPREVQPLIDDLNALLEEREQAVARALAKAGDLAHGLKTPLSVLAQEAERIAEPELAATVAQQLDRMHRQIEYHLAHARAAAFGRTSGARASVLEGAEALRRTLLRLHAARGLALELHVASELSVRTSREDFEEMLGNLLDNACKWARTRVEVHAVEDGEHVAIDVDDDGAGLEPELRESVLRRGVRADESVAGSGLGLAIVRELAELYGGSVTLAEAPLGGLRARLRLPR